MSPIKLDSPPNPSSSSSSPLSASGRQLRSKSNNHGMPGGEGGSSTITAPSPLPLPAQIRSQGASNELLLDVRAYHPHLSSPRSHRAELDLAHTPPPKTFTPSPPLSRAQSNENLHRLGRYEGENELAVLLRTIDFAARKHSCQRRKDVDQSPYINHPIAVANFLSSTGITDVRVLQAAVLHDTVEDTHTTIEEIAQSFGTDVARIVEECTDDNTLSGQQRKIEQLRNAPYKSREAQQVKLADKLHNLESIRRSPPVGWGIKRIQAYFIWAKQVTDVCANSHPALARRLQHLYETAYTRVNGVYYPCHPEVCGPLTEEEQERVDARLRALKPGATMKPEPIFF